MNLITDLSIQPWREENGHTVLLASRRAGQSALHFPPLPASSPLSGHSEIVALSPVAKLYSFTIVHASPKAAKPPMALGLVDFPEGVRVFGRMDYAPERRPVIGEALSVFIAETPDGPIYAFRPLEQEAAA